MTKRLLAALVALALALALSACSTTSATDTGATKSSATVAPPTLRLVAPVEGAEVAAGDVTIKVETTNLKFVTPNNKPTPGEGHVHFTLDDKPVQMSDKPEYVYTDVAPGRHKVVAELVQNDAKPFDSPVKQEISFTAK